MADFSHLTDRDDQGSKTDLGHPPDELSTN